MKKAQYVTTTVSLSDPTTARVTLQFVEADNKGVPVPGGDEGTIVLFGDDASPFFQSHLSEQADAALVTREKEATDATATARKADLEAKVAQLASDMQDKLATVARLDAEIAAKEAVLAKP